eukprot:TRINITY_DN16765_c0_g1_i1.p1 TRINITY_DN16765_c0_g1~~TRINITY_DN16765_c0_g1_i1.p1  ORF type:complete len:361 (-),score=63.10 TRINITY_DN16765_c0_g1_i1:27-1109(-)
MCIRDRVTYRSQSRNFCKNRDKQKNTTAPKNDYSQHYVDTGQRPQNFIRDTTLADRFEKYPKLKDLLHLKDEHLRTRRTKPHFLKCDLHDFPLTSLKTKFDVILVDPPWEEYISRAPMITHGKEQKKKSFWAFEEILSLEIEKIAANPCFIFLWVGSGKGLDEGRILLKKWGFRRCEDIVWAKTNKRKFSGGASGSGEAGKDKAVKDYSKYTPSLDEFGGQDKRCETGIANDTDSVMVHTKEHCLMGIKGTVRRSTDGHLIHANIDTDVIVSEERPLGDDSKPEEIYHIIEHFSLGMRRIELFGEDHNIRDGWLTLGNALTNSNWNAEEYGKLWEEKDSHLLGTTQEIEKLRPKSPPRKG